MVHTRESILAAVDEDENNGFRNLEYLHSIYGSTNTMDITDSKTALESTTWEGSGTIDNFTSRFLKLNEYHTT